MCHCLLDSGVRIPGNDPSEQEREIPDLASHSHPTDGTIVGGSHPMDPAAGYSCRVEPSSIIHGRPGRGPDTGPFLPPARYLHLPVTAGQPSLFLIILVFLFVCLGSSSCILYWRGRKIVFPKTQKVKK
jgi:hypothetical protein